MTKSKFKLQIINSNQLSAINLSCDKRRRQQRSCQRDSTRGPRKPTKSTRRLSPLGHRSNCRWVAEMSIILLLTTNQTTKMKIPLPARMSMKRRQASHFEKCVLFFNSTPASSVSYLNPAALKSRFRHHH